MEVAIDWGNSNTVMSLKTGSEGACLMVDSSPLVPSYSKYDCEGNLVSIGWDAKNSLLQGEEKSTKDDQDIVVTGIKQLIGVEFRYDKVKWARDVYGLNLDEEDGKFTIQIGNTYKTPEEIAIDFFQELRKLMTPEAKDKTGLFGKLLGKHKIEKCVATCPAHYSEVQIEALQRCIHEAGLNLIDNRLIAEPEAVGKLIQTNGRTHDRRTLVIDWGGGTLDFAVILPDGKPKYLAATMRGCGGIDMDVAILSGLHKEGRIPTSLGRHDSAVMRVVVEQMKEELLSSKGDNSVKREVSISKGDKLQISFSRDEIKKWVRLVLSKAMNGIDQILADIDEPITDCVLIGGPVKSKFIVDQIKTLLGSISVITQKNPMTAVSLGALKYVENDDDGVVSVLPHDYGVMVDLLNHGRGPVLLRSQTPCPVTSPSRTIEIRGSKGMPVKIAVWTRKSDPTEERNVYESSTEFMILPEFDNNHRAEIKVKLSADKSRVVTARVIDMASSQEIELKQVGMGISKQMDGPPCREHSEVIGLLLGNCWNRYQMESLLKGGMQSFLTGKEKGDEVDMEQFIKSYVEGGEGPPTNGLAEDLAERCLNSALEIDEPDSVLERNMESVQDMLDSKISSESDTRNLLRSIHKLLEAMVRGEGAINTIPGLQSLPQYSSDVDLKRRVDNLTSIMQNFRATRYGRMMAVIAEIRAGLQANSMGEEQELFALIEEIVNLRYETLMIEQKLEAKFARG